MNEAYCNIQARGMRVKTTSSGSAGPTQGPASSIIDPSALRAPTIANPRLSRLRNASGPVFLHAFHHAQRERHFRVRLLTLAALGAAERLGMVGGVTGIGIGSTHSSESSSRAAESAEIECEKSTGVALREVGLLARWDFPPYRSRSSRSLMPHA